MKLQKIIRISLGIVVLFVGALLLTACAVRIRQGDFRWLPTVIFGFALIFVGYGALSNQSLRDIIMSFTETITGRRR